MRYGIRAGVAFAIFTALAACNGSRPDYPARSAAPEVSFVVAPTAYTPSPSLPVRVEARNPTGVRAVYALSGSQRVTAAQQPDGTWQATVVLPAVGRNAVTVWAEDTASPVPNSGQGMDPPYQLVQDVVYDPTPPSAIYDATFFSYSDERTLALEVDENGIAKVPPAYVEGEKTYVPPGGHVYKVWSRLSGGSDMNARELETTNENNIPVLRFAIPYDPNSDSPVLPPTFVAHVSCPPPCPTYPDATGKLLQSPLTDNQHIFFDLPLATETIPALANLPGPAKISIELALADAAGNTTTAPGLEFTFHTIGQPLAIVEDAQYPAAVKPDSTYAYRLGDGSYSAMWTLGTQFQSNAVRLLRYIITNPSAAPVAVRLDVSQDARVSWQAVESWTRFNAGEPTGKNPDGSLYLNVPSTSAPYMLDGFTFRNAMFWRVPYGEMSGTLLQAEYGAYPCGAMTGGLIVHRMGDTANRFLCSSITGTPFLSATTETGTFSQADVSVFAYRVAPELQGQERDAAKDPSGQWFLVPPAAGDVPGALVVYLARPVLAPRTRLLQWNAAAASPPSDFVNHYQVWDYQWWWPYHQPMSGLYPGYDTYMAMRAGLYLAASRENLYGSLAWTTQAYPETVLLGEPSPRLAISFSREPLVVH